MRVCRRALGDKSTALGLETDGTATSSWSGQEAQPVGVAWGGSPPVETKGSRDLGFSSRAQPPAGQLLWSSPARPRDCRGEGSRQAPREPQCGLCRRGDEGPEGQAPE